MTDLNTSRDFHDDSHEDSMGSRPPRLRPGLLLAAVVAALVVGILIAPWIPWNPLHGGGSHSEAAADRQDTSTARASAGAEPDNIAEEDQLWTCAMHPHVLQHGPGQCPVCGMTLVPAGPGSATQSTAARRVEFYRHPMDPSITSPVPAKDSMGMDYVPVYANADGDGASDSDIVLNIDPTVQQNMNLRTAPAVRGDLSRNVRATGALDYDPESMVSVTTKVPGWIEKVYVHQVGETVRRGQPLFEVYSPELIQTGEELLAARRYANDLVSSAEGTPSPAPSSIQRSASERATHLVEAARRRLSYWDVSDAQIARIEASGVVPRTLTVTAPRSGTLMQRPTGLEGMAVSPGFEVLHLADLSRLWATVELFEEQLTWIDVGSAAEITLPHLPGETFEGTVRYLAPELSSATRTLAAQIEVVNPSRQLRPGMFVEVSFDPVVAAETLIIPSEAVLRTGERDVVILVLESPEVGTSASQTEGIPRRFAPREILVGRRADGQTEVLSGLSEGDLVVTSGQFLLDSEAQIQAAIRTQLEAMNKPGEKSP